MGGNGGQNQGPLPPSPPYPGGPMSGVNNPGGPSLNNNLHPHPHHNNHPSAHGGRDGPYIPGGGGRGGR